jgi:hypothetical protein
MGGNVALTSMFTALRHRRGYSTVVSATAAVIALGGGAFALASSLPGPDGAVHACFQTRHGNLRVVKPGTPCAAGERALSFNLPGAPGSAGAAGAAGDTGPVGQFPQGTLPSGTTVRGHWAAGLASAGSAYVAVSFLFEFAAPPTFNYVSGSGSPPAGCSGGTNTNPTAQPGNLCIYSSGSRVNTAGALDNHGPPSAFGAVFSVGSTSSGAFSDGGAWAATSP